MTALAPVPRSRLVAEQLAAPPFGPRRFTVEEPAVRVGITGSGADLLLLAWSAADLAREIAAGARVLGALGVRTAMRVANTLPGALATPGALLLGDVHEAIGALDVPLGVPESEAAARAGWELVDRVCCNVLVLDPATAPRFFAAMPAGERPWLAGVVWLRRPGTPHPASLPAGIACWQRSWLAVPEVASFAAASCSHDRLHVDGALEASVHDGELVLARRDAPGPPPYATGIRATLLASCPCGAAGPGVTL